jgi:small subunit ribosomal protein S8
MTMTDPIADMLTRIRNASLAYHPQTAMPSSKLKVSLAKLLQSEGYIEGLRVEGEEPKRTLVLDLRYGEDKTRTITGIRRVSKPGLRVYTKADSIPKVMGGLGIVVLSTSKGLMTDRAARKEHMGGEILCYVW